jgi:23S rRNA pseudouridine2605 synthase
MRINQFVAGATGISRRAADEAISLGRVLISGRTATLGEEVTPTDIVELDGERIRQPVEHTFVMLNKPAGYVSSRVRQGNTLTLYALLPPGMSKLRITGRLDRESSGLVILTDDGDFIQRHTHPSFEKRKVYEVTLSHKLSSGEETLIKSGIELEDGVSRVDILSSNDRTVTVSMHEGRNRQLRRMFAVLGLTVERLHRTEMGPFKLGKLPSGAWQAITEEGTV